jgi:hypothetical protein
MWLTDLMPDNVKLGMHSLPLRILMLLMGVGLIVAYALMAIVVTSGLPASWVGLVYVTVGLSAGIASIVFFFRQSRFGVLIIVLGVLQSLIFFVGNMLAGT